ncbi:MAG: AAA family ATPase [bacterium]|nr:AAA family ATPase [bacterium]
MKTKRLPVGVSDFKDMMTGNYCYVDKTLFIKEVIDKGDKILLIPRPRRFGKTLNLSMLKYFYDCCPDSWPTRSEPRPKNKGIREHSSKQLFQSLAISDAGNEYPDKMCKHPVIFLSFRSIKDTNWESCINKIKHLIRDEYSKHKYLPDSPALDEFEAEYFKGILNFTAITSDYEISLEKLLIFLSRHYGKRVVILIDEYDAPVYAGFNNGYYDQIINFIRNFLSGGLKDTGQYLEKSVITGIMRIAKESIFSGLNNPGVYTLLSDSFNDKFGFTEEEVKLLLREFNAADRYEYVREWYNGYRFGETLIYNPWSIINFLAEGAKKFKPYWINTSDNAIVESLLSSGGKELKEELELLISGRTIEKTIDDNIVLKHIDSYENSLWSFLLMGGYLKPTAERMDPITDTMIYTLAIPNREVRTTYTSIIKRYFATKIESKKLEIMLKALIDGDVKLFGKMLRKVVAAVFSYHDFGGEPEKVYHALVAGLLVWISDTHEVKSNRESGYGRYDIMIIPRDITLTGYVIEFKTVDEEEEETVPDAIKAALKQIEDRKYETELIERGIKNYKKLAIVFKGKDVTVKEG